MWGTNTSRLAALKPLLQVSRCCNQVRVARWGPKASALASCISLRLRSRCCNAEAWKVGRQCLDTSRTQEATPQIEVLQGRETHEMGRQRVGACSNPVVVTNTKVLNEVRLARWGSSTSTAAL